MAYKKLAVKEQKFVAAYLIEPNGKRAAMQAGAPERSAAVWASNTLKKRNVQAAIDRGIQRAALKAEVTQERIMAELAKLAFSNISSFIDLSEPGHPTFSLDDVTPDEMAALSEFTIDVIDEEVETEREDDNPIDEDGQPLRERRTTTTTRRLKIKLADKRSALADLARIKGMFKDNVAITGKDGAPLAAMVFRPRKPAPSSDLSADQPTDDNAGG